MSADGMTRRNRLPKRSLVRALMIAAILHRAPADAQVRPAVVAGTACSQCAVTTKLLFVLGDSAGPGALEGDRNVVHRDSRGRFYVTNDVSPHVWVFAPDGKFMRRLGAKGQGPGEFERISAVAIGKGDSLYVFDPRLRRLTIIAPDYTLARTAPLELSAGFDAAVVNGGVVVNASVRTPDKAGYPLHLVDGGGGIVRSFGSESGLYRPDIVHSTRRAITSAGDGGVWAAFLNQYVIEEWPSSGRQVRALKREVDWFPAYWQSDVNARAAPQPYTTALWATGDTLWVLISVAHPEWRMVVRQATPDGKFFTVDDEARYRRSVVEVIDTRRNRVLASSPMGDLLWGFAGQGLAYGPRTRSGWSAVCIWQLTVQLTQRGRIQ
jgi:hypothetical protein